MLNREQAWLALCLIEGLGSQVIENLLAHFGHDAAAVFRANAAALRRVSGIGPVLAGRITSADVPLMMQQVETWRASGITLLLRDDQAYPRRLHTLPNPPPVVFIQGSLDTLATFTPRTCAIVGTRTPSPQGVAAAAHLARERAEAGEVLISGLALGIDGQAHRAALDASTSTAAILGGGLLHLYPPAHVPLAERMLERASNVLLSETRPDQPVRVDRLVARNRLIAALADTVIVVESNEDGGALHAARWALQLERPVFTLDLPAAGNQQLIAQGVPALPVPMP